MRPARPILIALGLAAARPRPSTRLRPAPPDRGRPRSRSAGDAFRINGRPTYAGRTVARATRSKGSCSTPGWSRGSSTTSNPETRSMWAYPDTGTLGPRAEHPRVPRRHARVAAPRPARPSRSTSRAAAPQGYTKGRQPWHNSAIDRAGELRPDYMARLGRILDRADELGMVVILGIFYFGQDERLEDEAGRDPRPGQRRRLGARPGLPQRPDRGEQRVQRRSTTTRSCGPSASTS